jgi:peptidoglycan hydrolase CwlO-like protein
VKLSIGLGLALVTVLLSFVAYRSVMVSRMETMQIELQTCINNQAILENTIQKQNEDIKNALETAKKTQAQIASLNNQYTQSQQQVQKLRNKFANFNLEGMAMTEPLVLQGKVNRATARVIENFKTLTNDEETTNTATTN